MGGRFEGALAGKGQISVGLRIFCFRERERGFGKLTGRELFLEQPLAHGRNGERCNGALETHRSITLGTLKYPAPLMARIGQRFLHC